MIYKMSIFIRVFFLVFIVNLVFVLAYNSFSQTGGRPASKGGEVLSGERLFKANCAGCHANGQNLIKPNKPVVGSGKLKSKQLFKTFLQSPPPPMPNFKNISNKPTQLDALYTYVISLRGK